MHERTGQRCTPLLLPVTPRMCLLLQGEGSQTEPARVSPAATSEGASCSGDTCTVNNDASAGSSKGPHYQSYGPVAGVSEYLYLNLTAEFAARLAGQRQGQLKGAPAEEPPDGGFDHMQL